MHTVIVISGAESTGKSTLARQLTQHLSRHSGQAWVYVDEYLRAWCLERGRTPRPHEQWHIAAEQSRQIAQARQHAHVVADTSASTIAAYSELLFADTSLWPMALAAEAGVSRQLLTNCSLPWVADGFLRDGQFRQKSVHTLLEQRLAPHTMPADLLANQRLEWAVHQATAAALR